MVKVSNWDKQPKDGSVNSALEVWMWEMLLSSWLITKTFGEIIAELKQGGVVDIHYQIVLTKAGYEKSPIDVARIEVKVFIRSRFYLRNSKTAGERWR